MCKHACLVKVTYREPCADCLAEWAESTQDLHEFAKLCRKARLYKDRFEATDEERRAFLDQVAPVVTLELTESTELEYERTLS